VPGTRAIAPSKPTRTPFASSPTPGDDRLPLTLRGLKREHVESFIADQLARWKASTADNRYRGLQAFLQVGRGGGRLNANPMSGMEPPKIPRNRRPSWVKMTPPAAQGLRREGLRRSPRYGDRPPLAFGRKGRASGRRPAGLGPP
jgi:hypothetical protein